MSKSYSKDLCIVEFNEHSTLKGTQTRVLNAFIEGIMCFQFRFKGKDKRTLQLRKFEDRVALPLDAIEKDALDMAEDHFKEFANTAGLLAAGRLPPQQV